MPPYLEPDIADYIKNRIFLNEATRQEFYDRLENLCEQTYQVTESLKKDITWWLVKDAPVNEFLSVIQNFPSFTQPTFSEDLKQQFKAHLPGNLYLPWLRIFNRSCCPYINPADFGYQPYNWDFGVALYIYSTVPSDFSASFEYTINEAVDWFNTGFLSDAQLAGIDPIPVSAPSFWSRLQLTSPGNCTYYSEISTITS